MQYVDNGQGVAVFLSHGVLGGHDNARDLVDLWFGPEYRVIAPARFGYLGSDLPQNATVADQADTFAELLGNLQLQRVVMAGVSAGAPAAVQFALRHPDRLHCLILASAYLPGMGSRSLAPSLHPIIRTIVGWERGWWLMATYRPSLLARLMGVPPGWQTNDDDDFIAIRDALFPVAPKKRGVVFDALVSEPASDGFPLENITVPTLLVHAADDRLAPYEHVSPAASRIPGAELATIAGGGHLFLAHPAEVRTVTRTFIGKHIGGTARK